MSRGAGGSYPFALIKSDLHYFPGLPLCLAPYRQLLFNFFVTYTQKDDFSFYVAILNKYICKGKLCGILRWRTQAGGRNA